MTQTFGPSFSFRTGALFRNQLVQTNCVQLLGVTPVAQTALTRCTYGHSEAKPKIVN